MKRFFRPAALTWLALVVGATWWLAWSNGQRAARIAQVSSGAPAAASDAGSPTGYVRGMRSLLLPDSGASQAWIMDVQKMLATDRWQVARADYDNAPEGRAVQGPAAYRWWLRFVAGIERRLGAESDGAAVERAALHADPVLHLLLCLGGGLFIAWRWGAAAGGLLALGSAALLAHAQVFSSGQPDDHGLFLAATFTSLLLLLAGWQARDHRRAQWWLAAAGAAGGFALWLDAGSALVALGAQLAGGFTAVWLDSRAPAAPGRGSTSPWRAWAAGGALVAGAGWLLEGRPGGWLARDASVNHPLLALAWIAGAEVLARTERVARRQATRRDRVWLGAAALVAATALAWIFHRGAGSSFGPDHPALAARGSLATWFKDDGLSIGMVAILLPLLLLPAALLRLRGKSEWRAPLGFALAAAVVVVAAGCLQLRWWALVDVMLLGLLGLLAASAREGFDALVWRTGLGLSLLPALAAAWPAPAAAGALAPAEARALVERDLAQWLAQRAEPGTIAFAPPALSGSLAYYGGLRVVASPYPGNQDGLALAARIAGTPSTDEAQALIQRRGIQYIVLPSWDDSLDQLARLGSPTPERSLIALLRRWLPPRWLRPVAYQQPVIPGQEQDTLAIFEVVEPQENAIALSRLAEYFAETNRPELAAALAEALEKSFAADAGAMIARAKVALAHADGRTLATIMAELLPAVADGRDEDLPWDRRAQLALVLAQTRHPEQARAQVAFCLAEADVDRLRSLGPVSLFQLLSIARAFRVEFSDPQLAAIARNLLPAEFQAQLGG